MATPKKTSKKPVSEIPRAEKINIEQLFAQALARHNKDLIADKKSKLKELNHLALIAEEYLSCFALIGYSLQDEKVVIFNTPTSKDEAALVDLLRATFIDIANNRP
jgi:hypothetical protein